MHSTILFSTSDSAAVMGPAPTGHVALRVRGGRLMAISFGHKSPREAAGRIAKMCGTSAADEHETVRGEAAEFAEQLLERVVRYLSGEPESFSDVAVNVDHLSGFQQRVAAACRRIPYGATRTYGELAAIAGSSGAARAVGQVMASNRVPLVIPCHRVVGAGGRLGGFSAPEGLVMKRRLLSMESGTPAPVASASRDQRQLVY